MIRQSKAPYDERDAKQLVRSLLERRPGYLAEEHEPFTKGPGRALAWVFARYLQAIIQRLNQAPEKNKLAFLDFLGLELVAAQAARAPLVFQLSAKASDGRAPARTQVAAPPPPGSAAQVIFETEQAVGLSPARLTEVLSLWPGRDQYINHSAAYLSGESFQLFQKLRLRNTPHELYLAHDTLLNFAGESQIGVEFELSNASSEPLEIMWEYWDGKVWRRFKTFDPACLEVEEENRDVTNGLTQSGTVRLETDCAETVKTTVYGREAFWIRGRLVEPLVSGAGAALPLVENLRLSSSIKRPLKASLVATVRSVTNVASNTSVTVGDNRLVRVYLTNEAGQLLEEAGVPLSVDAVKLSSRDEPDYLPPVLNNRNEYEFDLPTGPPRKTYQLEVLFSKLEASTEVAYADPTKDLLVEAALNVTGLMPDTAFADGESLDLTKPFFPFGQQPQPGATFYFNHEELFNKPGAEVRIYISRTKSTQDETKATPLPTTTIPAPEDPNALLIAASADPTPPVENTIKRIVAWEYWNGRQWAPVNVSNPDADLDRTEIVDLIVPPDMAVTKVNDEEGLWMRVRLVSGGFGFNQTVTWIDERVRQNQPENTPPNQMTFFTHRPPALSNFLIGYTWQKGPYPAEQVVTYNDFQFEDHTFEAQWPGSTFLPFKQVADTTPALYLGFDKKLPVDRLGIYFEIVERRGETTGPALVWEYWNGSEWRELAADDETRGLRLPGILSFIAASDSQPLSRFGRELHWLRGRLKEDGPPGEPTVNGIFSNAVWAAQQQTFTDVPLGASTGLPDQVFRLTQIPINQGERIEVRELSGARANVGWRILALEISGGDQSTVAQLEEMLGREEPQDEIIKDDLRLLRDRNKRVTEVWVRWQERPHLFFSDREKRHYFIDRARGRVFFGDGVNGKIPPPGAAILAKQFRAGGGLSGNVAARAINQLLGAVPGVEAVFNPRAAEGGADGETPEAFATRGPQTIRHRGRAIAPSDYETLAREASPAVAVARALPTRNTSGRRLPGWVTLMIIPQSKEPRPWPSYGLRQQVRDFLAAHAPADLAAAEQIYVTGPDYVPVDVEATIAPLNAAEAGEVEGRARAALEDFLHPLRGGPEKRGWEPGRDVYLSDVASVLERVRGVDYVEELSLLVEQTPQGERIAVADDRIAIAGDIRLKLKAAERQGR